MSRFTSTSENVLLYLQVGLAVGAILLGCAYLTLGAPLSTSSKGETNQRKVARKKKKILKPKKKTKESDDVDVNVEGKVASEPRKRYLIRGFGEVDEPPCRDDSLHFGPV